MWAYYLSETPRQTDIKCSNCFWAKNAMPKFSASRPIFWGQLPELPEQEVAVNVHQLLPVQNQKDPIA